MKDAWLYIIAGVNVVLVVFFARRPRDAKALTLSLWVGLATVFLVGLAIIAAFRGEFTQAARALLLLLGVFTITGVIPVWLIKCYERLRTEKKIAPVVVTLSPPPRQAKPQIKKEDYSSHIERVRSHEEHQRKMAAAIERLRQRLGGKIHIVDPHGGVNEDVAVNRLVTDLPCYSESAVYYDRETHGFSPILVLTHKVDEEIQRDD